MKPKFKPECPKCGSRNIIYRIRLDSFICRICSNIWRKKVETKKVGA